ncbi:hypothetical protein [Streptomyces sp. NPDC005438]|uniref:hypothetical protein n=1 Tax=Streptomyces sp. NPDC005438 TaxID=3156880 RepID=UPI0033B31147
MTDRRRAAQTSDQDPGGADTSREDNPFAAPPEGAADQPWQPRGGRDDGPSSGPDDDRDRGASGQGDEPTPWGNRWSRQQPGRSGDGFGDAPEGRNGGNGNGNGNGGPRMRWDPRDPVQRRARYAMLAGLWGFFFAAFVSFPSIGLLLGALGLYWGISALRGKNDPPANGDDRSRDSEGGASALGPWGAGPSDEPATTRNGRTTRPVATSAISGIVLASLALTVVAANYTVRIVYRDYYACVNDSLTTDSRKECRDLVPKQLRPLVEQD